MQNIPHIGLETESIVIFSLLAIAGLFTAIPVLGAILGILLRAIGSLIDLYVVAGIVIEVLLFAKVLKD